MKKLIELTGIECRERENSDLEVVYKLIVDNEPFDLKYSISIMGIHPEQTKIDKIPQLCDPVVVSLMYNLLAGGYDFKSEIPISERLYHHLTKDFIPNIVSMNKIKCPPELIVPVDQTPLKQEASWVGTGVSCGIDSFAAIKEYSEEKLEKYRLTHLLYFKVGAHHGRIHPCPEDVENRIFHEELAIADNFCKQNDYKLVVVDSNIDQMANQFWGVIPFGNVAWFRNVGVMLMLQAYFSKYIFGTSYTFEDFNMDFRDGLEFNLMWSMPLLGSDNLEVTPASSAMTRVEKTASIANFAPAFDNLMVCWSGHINCGECAKCIRTLVALDWLGALDNFKNSFDIEKYHSKKKQHLQHIVKCSKYDPFFRELVDYAKANNIKLPGKAAAYIGEYWRIARSHRLSHLPGLAFHRIKSIFTNH